MPDAHDPAALVRHAVQAGDWRLVELIARMLGGQSSAQSLGAPARLRDARREARPRAAIPPITIAADGGDRTRRRGVPRRHPELRVGRRDPAGPDRGDRRHARRPARSRRRGPRNGARRARARPRPGPVRAAAAGASARSGSTPRRPAQWPARRRFTIAHELGHWRLHRDAASAASSAARDRSSPRRRRLARRSRPPRTRRTCSRPPC